MQKKRVKTVEIDDNYIRERERGVNKTVKQNDKMIEEA